MKALFFADQEEFRQWLEHNHARKTELIVGFYKVGSGKPSLTWSEAVDQALCFGWIDGIRRSIDADSYSIRFTPRKPKSIWSAVNIKKIEDLTAKGLMRPAGAAAFEKRSDDRSQIYAYENSSDQLPEEFEIQFKANEKAWQFFQNQPPSYRKTMIHRIITAKQEKTRQSRLEKLINESANGKRI